MRDRVVGAGSFGATWAARHAHTGAACALKVFDRRVVKAHGAEAAVRRERDVLALLGDFPEPSPFVLYLKYAFSDAPGQAAGGASPALKMFGSGSHGGGGGGGGGANGGGSKGLAAAFAAAAGRPLFSGGGFNRTLHMADRPNWCDDRKYEPLFDDYGNVNPRKTTAKAAPRYVKRTPHPSRH